MAVLILWLTPYGFFFLKYYRFLFCKICFLLFESKNLNLHISPFFYKLKLTKSYFCSNFFVGKAKTIDWQEELFFKMKLYEKFYNPRNKKLRNRAINNRREWNGEIFNPENDGHLAHDAYIIIIKLGRTRRMYATLGPKSL